MLNDVFPFTVGFATVKCVPKLNVPSGDGMTETVPALSIREVGTCARSVVEETYVVIRLVRSSHITFVDGVKFTPVTVIVKSGEAASMPAGVT